MDRLTMARVAGLLLSLALAGCAQPADKAGSSATAQQVPAFIPSDHWTASKAYKNASVSAVDHKAALMVGCGDHDPTILLVSPGKKLPIDGGPLPVTIILDRKITFIQNWVATPDAGYGIADSDPGFMTVVETLQKYQEVEFVLGRPGQDIDDRSFTLNGAKAAIDQVLVQCGNSK